MPFLKNRILIHFDTYAIKAYEVKREMLRMLYEKKVSFNKENIECEISSNLGKFLDKLDQYTDASEYEYIRLYGTGVFQVLDKEKVVQLINHVFIHYGLYFNIVNTDLEQFYLEKSRMLYGYEDFVKGLICQEFRTVTVCGSFKHSIKEIEDTIAVLRQQNINVLSPTTTKLRPETLGSNFVLFEGQELKNERDAWRLQFEHISQFSKSDAVVICNPKGTVGKGALFELGYLTAISKRIIFTENPRNLSIVFPYEIGLNF